MKLYFTPQSTCSQKVLLVLSEKRVSFEKRVMDWQGGEHLAPWYLKINPNGVVPTLVHHDQSIVDSSVIVEYLDELIQEHPLRPDNLIDRARMRAWRQYIDEVPTAAIRQPSFNAHLVHLWEHMTDREFEEFSVKHPLRADFYRRMGKRGFDAAEIEESTRRLNDALTRMEAAMDRGGPWLNGAEISLVDFSMLPTIVRMDDLGMTSLWADRPSVAAWYDRMQERPSFGEVYGGAARSFPQRAPETNGVPGPIG